VTILKRIIVYFGVPPMGQSVYIDTLIRKTVSIDKILVVRFNMVHIKSYSTGLATLEAR